MILWRISEFADLSGEGGLIAEGRWNSAGGPIVYMAESSALAMLEVLVGLGVGRMPRNFQLLRIEGPDDVTGSRFPDHVPRSISQSRDWVDAWLRDGRTALAQVPSVVAPHSSNWLLNPLHSDAGVFSITAKDRWPWDKRLFR